MTTTIKPTHNSPEGFTCTTRGGHPVRIYATDGGISRDEIQGAIFKSHLGWVQFSWLPNGHAFWPEKTHDYDLIETDQNSRNFAGGT